MPVLCRWRWREIHLPVIHNPHLRDTQHDDAQLLVGPFLDLVGEGLMIEAVRIGLVATRHHIPVRCTQPTVGRAN